ncbi:MAG TPA: EthD domain-containing protein [Pseudonocardia sp.]|jgi:uncharacterized protein (TIGR02118 family)|nr:EthD domain-containing protein [Pseudonocardia sp.]
MIKIVYVLRARGDIDEAEFYRYWLEEHAPKMRSIARTVGAVRYVQSHTVETPLSRPMIESRGMSRPFEGVTEVWFESREAMVAGLSTAEGAAGMQMLLEDEKHFVDLAGSTMFVTEEHTIFDFSPPPATPS